MNVVNAGAEQGQKGHSKRDCPKGPKPSFQ